MSIISDVFSDDMCEHMQQQLADCVLLRGHDDVVYEKHLFAMLLGLVLVAICDNLLLIAFFSGA